MTRDKHDVSADTVGCSTLKETLQNISGTKIFAMLPEKHIIQAFLTAMSCKFIQRRPCQGIVQNNIVCNYTLWRSNTITL